MAPYAEFAEFAPGGEVWCSEWSGAYRSGKVWKSGGPKGEATRDGAALLTGVNFNTPAAGKRFLAELVKRSGMTEEAAGLKLNLLCSKRNTRKWGCYSSFKILKGKVTTQIRIYRWNLGTLVHEFAHYVDHALQGEAWKRLTSGSGCHGPKFYEVLEEMHGIAFEILGTTEAAMYEALQERFTIEEATRRAAAERFDESAEQMKKALRKAA